MIKNSFIFLRGVGYKRERNLWKLGIKDWNDFLSAERIKGISKMNKRKFDAQINDAEIAFSNKEMNFFLKYFPRREFWRMYPWLREDALYFDIETDEFGKLLVISISDGEHVKTFVRNFNMNFRELSLIFSRAKMLVSFNGSSFDLPVLRHYIKIHDKIHFDLRHAFVRLGYNTGLKEIEKIFGVKRDDDVADFHGRDALEFWRFFKSSGNKDALKLVIKYNRYDAVNLESLAEIAYSELKRRTFESEL